MLTAWIRMTRGAMAGTALLMALVGGGCAAVPDVSPFARASRQLAAAVRASGVAISDDLHGSPALAARAQEFDRAWAARNDAMRALVTYSDNLAGVVTATGDSRASARSAADKVAILAQTLGVVQPGLAPAVSLGSDTAVFLWAQIALAKGAASLAEALVHAQPAIERMAEIIISDHRDLAVIVGAVAEEQRTAVAAASNEPYGYMKMLARRRAELRSKEYARLTEQDVAELRRIEELVAPVRVQLQEHEAQKARIDRRHKARVQLLAATREAMERWATAHQDVVRSLEQRRPVSVESLADAAVELRGLIKRVQEL